MRFFLVVSCEFHYCSKFQKFEIIMLIIQPQLSLASEPFNQNKDRVTQLSLFVDQYSDTIELSVLLGANNRDMIELFSKA